jgi:hypothetical protein
VLLAITLASTNELVARRICINAQMVFAWQVLLAVLLLLQEMDVQILLIHINAGMVNALQVLINALFLLVAILILHQQIVDSVIRHVLLVRFDVLMVLVLLLIHVQLLMVVL